MLWTTKAKQVNKYFKTDIFHKLSSIHLLFNLRPVKLFWRLELNSIFQQLTN